MWDTHQDYWEEHHQYLTRRMMDLDSGVDTTMATLIVQIVTNGAVV